MTADSIPVRLRALVARVLEQPPAAVLALPDDTPLFSAGLALDSLTGMELLAAVHQEFGVDVAGEDLNLDSLESLGTLAAFLGAHDMKPDA